MISHTDATTLNPATTTTINITAHHNHHNHHNHHPNKSPTVTIYNGKGSKGPQMVSNKRRKRFDETIIDGFAITAFKTWEDLQDELNERGSLNSINNNSTNINDGNYDTICTADKKSEINKSKQKSSCTSSTSSGNSDISSSTASNNAAVLIKDTGSKKKDKAVKRIAGLSQANAGKDKRNKTSSDKTSLKRALEAKELAEKRVSILQEKLKHEQSKNRSHNISNKTTSIIPTDQYLIDRRSPTQVKEELHSRANGMLAQDVLKDANSVSKQAPYTPFHINSNLHGSNVATHQQIQHHNPPPLARVIQNQPEPRYIKNPSHPLQSQSHRTPPPPKSHVHQSQQSPPPTQPQLTQSTQSLFPHHNINPSQYQRPHLQAQLNTPQQPTQTLPQHPHLIPPPPPIHSYPHPPSTSMMSSMGLGLPSPYSCPPSIYITDTISRQTSIIPPIAPSLEQAAPPIPSNRFGHSSVMHSISPYNPAVPPHHSMYYPTLPTERSFVEYARTYSGASHPLGGYPSLINSFPTPSPSITANPYSLDRWPRTALDHQRAISRYNSLYQSTTILPDRTYAGYAGIRPPTYPSGLFPPPF